MLNPNVNKVGGIPPGTSKLEALQYLFGGQNKALYSWRGLVAALLSFYGYYTHSLQTEQTRIVNEQEKIKAVVAAPPTDPIRYPGMVIDQPPLPVSSPKNKQNKQ